MVELQVHWCLLATTTGIQVWASHPWGFLLVGGWVKGLVVGMGWGRGEFLRLFPAENGAHEEVGDLVELLVHRCLKRLSPG